MFLRGAGVLVLLACAVLAVIAVIGLKNSPETGRLMSMASRSTDQPFEASDWQRHWVLTTGLLLASSLAGCIAGLGLIVRRRWALALLATVVSANLLVAAIFEFSGLAKYRFEVSGPAELGVLAIVAAALWSCYVKMAQHDRAVGSVP